MARTKEIDTAEYGQAPPGDEFLITGHECFGQVLEEGKEVTEFAPGDYAVPTVRRAGQSFVDDKLYLHYSLSMQTRRQKDIPGYIRQADSNWPEVSAHTKVHQ